MDPNQPTGNSATAQPDQQELYNIFVGFGTKLAAGASDKLKGQTAQSPGIVGTIGDAVVDIINKVEDEGAASGVRFDDAIKLHGTQNILANLLSMAKIELNKDQIKQAVGHIVGRYIDEGLKSGKLTKDQVASYGQQLEQQGAPQSPAGPPPGQTPPMQR
jgi:hypothetical protein